MDFKKLVLLACLCTNVAKGQQVFEPKIISLNSVNNTYSVPSDSILKLEGVGFTCPVYSHRDVLKINSKEIVLREHYYNLHGGTNSQSQSVWTMKMPIWIPEGTIIEHSNHADLVLFGILLPK